MSKTKDMLIDVARQLFAKNGVENTTINDIAIASNKGRRTIYTYFRNKDEIYWAVVESELSHISKRLNELAAKDLPPQEKLLAYIHVRLEAVKETVFRNGTLKADFFRDIWRVEHVRKSIDKQERQVLEDILTDGVEKGEFQMPNVHATATVLLFALRGLDVPYIRYNFSEVGMDRERLKDYVLDFILYGIKK